MSDSSQFSPVLEPYDVRVVAVYLSQAFNGGAMDVPPTSSPVWPLACRMVELLRRDRYALGAWYHSELAQPRQLPAPQPYRAVRMVHQPERRAFRPPAAHPVAPAAHPVGAD